MKEKYNQPKGQILLFAPSYSGKSYLTKIFRKMGLLVFDLEKEGKYIEWINDASGKPVGVPGTKTAEWLSENHYLANKKRIKSFLNKKSDCIVFAHSWNILDCLNLFTRAYFMYVPEEELIKRMTKVRKDHITPSQDQLKFMLSRHKTRLKESKSLGIPIVDVSQPPDKILKLIE